MNFTKAMSSAMQVAGKYAPGIYTGAGIGLSILTTVLVGKNTPKALELKKTIELEEDRDLMFKEKIEIFAKSYWPAILTGTFSIGLIICGQHVQYKRTAAATAAYLIAQDSLKNLTDKVTDEIGKDGITKIKDRIRHEKFEKQVINEDEIIPTDLGDDLCYDAINGRFFKSSIEAIRKAESEMNKRLLKENFISINEFFMELDLPSTKFGDELGWDVGLEGAVDIEVTCGKTPQEKLYYVIDSDICPRWHLYS